ncbi:MAG: nucleotide exchange factor GrpE [Methanobrevibacter sp.]|uniref:nucleotide exchange factor GrpE n=1 Tax=Methanobrevibacter sp. TaxID=66852 RepID=UPI0026E0828F|nr:nucleotide exchange factor GrpE [Methanobrevibacter sp.]MDO5848042.1 nucleotide exchange factor GrpE [Methanobrevibacter sp.]
MASDKEEKIEEEEKDLQDDDTTKEESSENDEVTKLKEEIETLKEELASQEEKTNEYISYSQRLQADFENFKKINEKQKQEVIKYANENLIKNILDSYEDLGRALENSSNYDELKEGIELINNKLHDALKKEGLEEIPTKGEKFDPFKHEALMAEANDDVENGYIIEELMKGYTLKDKVIKYSKVKVCKK